MESGFDFARIAAGEVHIDAVDSNQNDGAEKSQTDDEVQRRLDSGQKRAKIAQNTVRSGNNALHQAGICRERRETNN